MSWPELLMLGVVLAVGVPAAFRNPTAAALVAAWAFAQGVWLATGDNLPLRAYIVTDIAVLAVIYCKRLRWRGPYRNWWHRLQSILLEPNGWDRVVILIFPVMWMLYIVSMNERAKWFALFWLAIAQFLAAGGGALQSWLIARKANAEQPPATGPPAVYRWALGRGHG